MIRLRHRWDAAPEISYRFGPNEIDLRHDGKLPCSYRQAEIFNREGGIPLARYTLDDRYGERAMGVHLNGDQPGRLAPND